MRLLAPGVAALLVGCAAPAHVAPPPPGTFAPLALAEFPAAASLLAGFDERSTEPDWLARDRVLFGLRLDGDAEPVRWLLLVEVPLGSVLAVRESNGSERRVAAGGVATWRFTAGAGDEEREITIESRLVNARAKVFTAAGELLTDTEDALPLDLLARGLVPAVERARATGSTSPTDREMLEGLLAVQRLLEIVRGNEALADYFWRVVEKPSVWSVLVNLGVRVGVDLALERAVPLAPPPPLPPGPPTYAVPLRIDVNGSPALFVDLLATDARRPFALCGGLVGAIARHPSRPERTFRMQLLAARLGAIPDVRVDAEPR